MRPNSARAARAHGRAAEPHQARQGAADACRCPQSIAPRCMPACARRRGSLLVLVPVVAMMLMGMAVLAVDWGRIQVVKGELQAAADAATLFALSGPTDATALVRARAAAAENRANGQPVILSDADVQLGRWDPDTNGFTASALSPDAVRVTARATVPLVFGALVGRSEVQVSASAVALGPSEASYGLVGLDYVRLNSDSVVDAYNSTIGDYALSKSDGSSIATNGYIDINSNSRLYGDAWHRSGKSFKVNSGSLVVPPGQERILPAPLSFPAASLPASYINKGSYSQDGGTLTLNAGNYRYSDLVINSGAKLIINGKVTIYVTSKFEVNSISTASSQIPSQLTIVGIGSAMISVNSDSVLAADIYAPRGEVKINSRSVLYGRAVGKSILVNSGAQVHYDKSLGVAMSKKARLVQ